MEFSLKKAVYLDSEANSKSESKPRGGSLISLCCETMITNSQHSNFFQG